MKVLFVYRGVESIGVGTLLSLLEAEGHRTRLLFDPGLDDNLYVRMPALRVLNRHDRLLRQARAFDPDLVAFSCTSNLFPAVRDLMHRLRPHLRAPFVIGGVHATVLPEYVLRATPAAFACMGEGENPLRDLVAALESGTPPTGIPGLFIARGEEIERNPAGPLIEDLDALPFPRKEPFFRYGCFRSRVSVMTSRGCPFHCAYCSNDVYFRLPTGPRRAVRRRSPENVLAEVDRLRTRFPARSFWFCDDVFALDRGWLQAFVERYRSTGPLPFDCHLHPNVVDAERVSLLKEGGCRHVFLGVDAGDERIRREVMGRPVSEGQIRGAVARIREAGIRLTVSAIFGLPGEGPAEMRKTLDLCSDLRADGTSSYIFYPFYGTRLFAYARERGYLSDDKVERIRRGEGSYHHESLLDHPHKSLADTYSKITPLYTRVPRPLRRILDVLIARRSFRAAAVLYAVCTPLAFPVVGISWVADTARMAWRASRA